MIELALSQFLTSRPENRQPILSDLEDSPSEFPTALVRSRGNAEWRCLCLRQWLSRERKHRAGDLRRGRPRSQGLGDDHGETGRRLVSLKGENW